MYELPDIVDKASTMNTFKNRLVRESGQQKFALNSSPDILQVQVSKYWAGLVDMLESPLLIYLIYSSVSP